MNDRELELRAQLFNLKQAIWKHAGRVCLALACLLFLVAGLRTGNDRYYLLALFYWCFEMDLRIKKLERHQ